ncbi:oxidation resistance protein 1 [Gryganskiella cystojenkinii]|nr:oxidation resistance protein 1 [Gryganskiella cystojenkinii]
MPLRAKQGAFTLLTTEQPKYGPARSAQSTVRGGDWGEPSSSSSFSPPQQGAEPNSSSSATAGPDSWTYLSDSGFPVPQPSLGSAGSPPLSASTPMTVREAQVNKLPALQLLDRNDDTDPVLDLDVAHQIRLELPRKLRNATKWSLVYSSDQHGISMTTLYHRCKGKGPIILAIKDTTDAVFGAFVNEEFKTNLSYYGTGECFLWNVTTVIGSPQLQTPGSPTFGPSPLPSPSPFQLSSNVTTPYNGRSPSPSHISSTSSNTSRGNNNNGAGGDRRHDLFMAMNDQLSLAVRSPSPLSNSPLQVTNSASSSPTLKPTISTPSSAGGGSTAATPSRRRKRQRMAQFWKWSGKNDYMVLSEPGFIGLGGGDGKFGLWIHSDLETGHSARCATFDNEPLAAACHHPVRLSNNGVGEGVGGGTQISLAPTAIRNTSTVAAVAASPSSRSSSPRDPSDKEEFFCQTIEIWAIVL